MTSDKMATTQLKHASLKTTLKGLDLGDVNQFRGIKFASIGARFEKSNIFDQYKTDELDCTQHGLVQFGVKFSTKIISEGQFVRKQLEILSCHCVFHLSNE